MVHAVAAEGIAQMFLGQAAHGASPTRLGGGLERLQMVGDEVVCDLPPRRQPHLVVAGDVAQRLLEGLEAVGPADQIGMQRDAHHRAAVCPSSYSLSNWRRMISAYARGPTWLTE